MITWRCWSKTLSALLATSKIVTFATRLNTSQGRINSRYWLHAPYQSWIGTHCQDSIGANTVFLTAQLEGQKLGNTCAVVADGSEMRTDKILAGGWLVGDKRIHELSDKIISQAYHLNHISQIKCPGT